MHVDDLQLLQADVEGLELAVVPVQGDDLEEAVVEPQANHATLGVHNADYARLGGPAHAVLQGGGNKHSVGFTHSDTIWMGL